MNVGIITVRKKWNNAPTGLSEGIKKGILDIRKEFSNTGNIKFVFSPFTIHNPHKLYIDPESVKCFDIIIIPFWIGARIFNCNFKELKQKCKNIKICLYTGINPLEHPAFHLNFQPGYVARNDISYNLWENFKAIDCFFVVKKLENYSSLFYLEDGSFFDTNVKISNQEKKFIFVKEVEVGMGQFDFLDKREKKKDIIILDFCKKGWDEFIWEDFYSVWSKIKEKNKNISLIQLGNYPKKFPKEGIFNRKFVHFRRLCRVYSKSKIFVSMNESFGYPILENKYFGNLILANEKSELLDFHFNSGKVIRWNKENVADIIFNYLKNFSESKSLDIRNCFKKNNPQLISWKKTVEKIINEIQYL